jgi:uncharacterized protein (DUF305 family)
MTTRFRSQLWAAGLLLLGSACSGGGKAPKTSPEPAPTHPPENRASTARAKPGGYPYTPADVQFMTDMIAHHAQALVMASWAKSHGASPSVQTLAGRIINGQKDEIATMQRWLRDRGQPVPEPDTSATPQPMAMHMSGHGQDHQMLMPGMLTEAQMKELSQVHGTDFDRLFLTDMIQHHKGAVTMVNQLFGTEGAAREETTFKLANDVSVDQTTEIARMQRMLGGLQSSHGSP